MMVASKRERFPQPRASGCCRFGQQTFAGASGNDEDAPTAVVRCVASGRLGPTLESYSWPTSVDAWADQGADVRAGSRLVPVAGSRQFAEQRLRLFQIGCVEAFGEPAVDWREKIAGFGSAVLIAAEPGKARGGAQLPELCFLPHGDA